MNIRNGVCRKEPKNILNHKYIPPIWLLEQLSYCYVMAFISSFVTTSRVYLCLLPVLLLVCRLEIVSFLKKIRPHFFKKI